MIFLAVVLLLEMFLSIDDTRTASTASFDLHCADVDALCGRAMSTVARLEAGFQETPSLHECVRNLMLRLIAHCTWHACVVAHSKCK